MERALRAAGSVAKAARLMPDLLTYDQAAKLLDPTGKLGISARSIQRHVAAGRLPKVRVGRKPAVLKSDVMRLIEPPPEPATARRIGRSHGNTPAGNGHFTKRMLDQMRKGR